MLPAFGVLVGLALGLIAGGSINNLVRIRLRWLPILVIAAAGRLGLDAALASGGMPDGLRLWLVMIVYALLTAMLLANRGLPGLTAAALGTVANGVAIAINGGWMPVWQPSLSAAGFDPNVVRSDFHTLLTGPVDSTAFFAHGGPLADVIPIPIPIIHSVASVGDLLLGAGLALFVFAALAREPIAALADAAIPGQTAGGAAVWRGAMRHPYVRLASNGPFSAMWLGQVVSSLGDRVHQVALVFLVTRATNSSPLALGLVFAAMTVPTFVIGPVAGALVDRWDRKRVMVASDLIRAAIVVMIPVAAAVNIGLVVVMVFGLAAVSSFFRPARVAALPLVVADEDLLTANSAMWTADTVSDLAGYGLGGLFVAFLGPALALAFWLDGASYLASAMLVAAVAIPRLVPGTASGDATDAAPATSLRSELVTGWRFLRTESVLFATTVQAAIAELGLGALTALSPLLVAGLVLGSIDAPTAYGWFEMSMGAGLLAGGLVLGGLATRLPKGPTIVVAFTVVGVTLVALAATSSLPIALGLACLIGVANVSFVVPSQTIFQQRTPGELLGRVVAIRLAAVNGVLAFAMVTSGVLAQAFGLHAVFLACGVVTVAAGLAGLAFRAIREA